MSAPTPADASFRLRPRLAGWWNGLPFGVRATAGLLAIGLTWGLLGPQLPIALVALPTLMANCAETFAKFPSVETPWYLGLNWRGIPGGVIFLLAILGAVVHLGAGWWASRLARPGGRWAEAGGGALAGLCAGLIAFATSIGPAFVLALAVVPTISDLTLLGERPSASVAGAPSPETAADPLVARYPELAAEPAEKRGQLVFPKVVATNVTGTFEAVGLGLAVSLALFVPAGAALSLVAGAMVRRYATTGAAAAAYAEAGVAVTAIQVLAFGGVSAGWGEYPQHLLGPVVLAIVVALVPAIALGYRWPTKQRYTAYGTLLIALAANSVITRHSDWGGVVVLVGLTPVYMVVTRQRFRPWVYGAGLATAVIAHLVFNGTGFWQCVLWCLIAAPAVGWIRHLVRTSRNDTAGPVMVT